jgi:hypothetical protein
MKSETEPLDEIFDDLSHREVEPAAQAETAWSDVAFGATKEDELHDDVTAVDIKGMAREAQQRDARETRLDYGRHAAEQRKINSVFKFRTRSDGAPRIVPIFTPVLSTQATSVNCFPDAAT